MSTPSLTSPITRLTRLIAHEREDIALLLLLTLGYGLLTIAMPLAVQTLVNNVVIGGVIQPLVVVSVILFVLLLVSSALYLTEVYLVEIIQRRIFVRMSARIAKNISGTKLSAYENKNPVELMNRFFDVMTIQKSVATLLTVSLTALLQGVIGSVILLLYSIYFAGAVLLMIAIIAFIVIKLGKPAEETAIKESSSKYKMAAWLERLAKNKSLAKFFHANARTTQTTDAYAVQYLKAREKHFGVLLKQQITVFALYTLMGTGILVMTGMLVLEGAINIGQFVAAELIIFGVLAAYVRFVTKLESFYDMLAALDKLGVIFDLPQEGNQTQHQVDHISQLSVKDLSVNTDTGQLVIDAFNVEIQSGQSLAVLGESGVGKTLLAESLTGLRAFSAGTIQFDGIDIRQLALANLRDHMALIDQLEWIDGSVLDNITLKQPARELDNVTACLKGLGILTFIHALPKGLDTPFNTACHLLTAPQLKLLLLARAIVAKSQLIIVDRLFDSFNEEILAQAVNGLAMHQENRMLIVMTRSPSVAKHFDQQITLGGQSS